MSNLFGVHVPFTGYGPQYKVGDQFPGFTPPSGYGQPGSPAMGAMGGGAGLAGSPVGAQLLARLGLSGLSGVTSAYQGGPTPAAGPSPLTPPGQPGSPGGQPGGIGGWLQTHGDALKGIGGLLQGGAAAYGTVAEMQAERRRQRLAEQEAERRRKDQDATAAAVAPGYTALLQALAGKMGASGQGG